MAAQTVLILDFGGQYKELIARRVRECGVYSIVKPGDISLDKIREIDPIGIILTGGPNSVYEKESPPLRQGHIRYRYTGARHMLRYAVALLVARRRSSSLLLQRIRQDKDAGKHRFPAVCRARPRTDRADEPYRSGDKAPRGIQINCSHRLLRECGNRKCR